MKNFALKNIHLPTPRRIKKIGDALAAAGIFVGAGTFISDYPKIALASLLTGGVGKFLATCFGLDEDIKTKENEEIL